MGGRIDLDHVALAFDRAWDGFDRYRGDLGGEFIGGGPDPGFSWHQLRFANGMKLELLEPHDVDADDFLRRFLDRNGPGPHHLTFKVPDIRAAIDAAAAAGFPPVRVNLEHPHWMEAFIHPRTAPGIVVQMAQSRGGDPPAVDGIPRPRTGAAARLERVVHLVADLDHALHLFEGVLGGEPTPARDPLGPRAVDLAWPGPGRVRLIEPAAADRSGILGDRPGALHHLLFSGFAGRADPAPDPDRSRAVAPIPIAGVVPLGEGLYELPPERNLGTRLRVAVTAGREA